MDPNEARDPRLTALALTAFAVALYLALIVASFGVISLVTDTDVIDEPDSSLLLGPTMSGTAVIIVALRLVAVAARLVSEREQGDLVVRVPLVGGILTGLAALAAYCVVGGMFQALAVGDVDLVLSVALHELLRPYSLAVGVLAFVMHVLFAIVLAAGGPEPKRPLWPWEK